MTQEAIQKQVNAIKKANSEARQSKESATKFLIDAGIIKNDKKAAPLPNKKKK